MSKINDLQRGYILSIPFKYEDNIIRIKDIYEKLKCYDFFVFQLEKGVESGYRHYQLYVEHENKISFNALKGKLPFAHIEKRNGTKKQAYNYCTKKDTRLHGPWQFGIVPNFNEKPGTSSLRADFVDDVKLGMQDYELLLKYPTIFTKRYVSEIRDVLKINLFTNDRDVIVHYITGDTCTGKSYFVRKRYNVNDIYVVSDYERDPFGSYKGQKVIIFEEYRSNFPLSMFLQYLDRYPVELPARFENKQAQYLDVYIISNWKLDEQYYNLSTIDKAALFRRIKYRYYFTQDRIVRYTFNEKNVQIDYKKIYNPLSDLLPFDMPNLDFDDFKRRF